MYGRLTTLAALGLLAGGCQTTATVPLEAASAELTPVPKRDPVVGDIWRYRNKAGEEHHDEVLAVEGDRVTSRDTEGCQWTSTDRFAPASSWQGCSNSADGTQQATQSGEIYPIELGKTVAYEVQGSNQRGERWRTTRRCSVEETARVSVPAGTFDSYRVVCEDRWRVREFFIAPEVGTTVLYTSTPKRRGEASRSELVSWEPAEG